MPPSKTKRSTYSNAPSAPEGTFLHDVTPVDNQKGTPKNEKSMRDSHDLSMAAIQRQSLVDNMLMSLDQYGSGAYSNYAALYNNLDDENTVPPAIFRRRGHTLSSSSSSNHGKGGPVDDALSRYSSHPSKGRRSHSSSNFPTSPHRNGAPPVPMHGRGVMSKKGSKSSGSSSVDFGYGQVLGTSKWGMHSAHRSASVDNIYDSAKRHSPARQQSTMMDRGRPLPLEIWDGDDEAAPEPLVRSGPVRQSRNSSPLRLPPRSSYGPTSKENVRSSLRELYQKSAGDTHIPESIRRQASDFVNASTMPPEALMADPIAPAPAIFYRKPSDGAHSSGSNLGTSKDRPGFFKRVFGSSKTNTPSPNPRDSVLSHQTNGIEHGENAKLLKTRANPNHIASQLRADAKPASHDAHAGTEPQRPPLQKKPSSFFRRRKRSVTDTRPPPTLPAQLNSPAHPQMQPAQPSPSISSLRKVMTPWLANGRASPTEALFDPRQTVRVENDNTVCMDDPYVEHAKHHAAPASAGSAASETTPGPGSLMPNESMAAEQKIKTSLMRHDQGDTFLADNSDVEDRPQHAHESTEVRTGTKESGEPTFMQSHLLTAEVRSPPGPEQLSKKVSVPSQATSPQSLETARTHWDSTEKILPPDEETYIVATQNKDNIQLPNSSDKSQRVWLNPTESEEKLDQASTHLTLPFEGARSSTRGTSPSSEADDELSASAPDARPSGELPTRIQDAPRSVSAAAAAAPFTDVSEPTEEDRERAHQIFNGDETLISKSEATAWLGDKELVNLRTRKAYMELFDWIDLNILAAMRDFCNKSVLKGETQQIDRLLHAFSRRWCACNPNHGFKDFGKDVHRILWLLLMC